MNDKIRVLFMGTPEFSVPCFEALIKSGYDVVGAVTQPDKPKGRGHKLIPMPVKACAAEHGIEVFQPETLKNEALKPVLERTEPDIIIVVAYGKILPEYILSFPRLGCINVHASLLPRYRGAGPIQWSVINGESVTGVTTMYMERGLDTGDMIFIENDAKLLLQRLPEDVKNIHYHDGETHIRQLLEKYALVPARGSSLVAATVRGLILTVSHKEQIGELYPQVLETLVYGACRELFG